MREAFGKAAADRIGNSHEYNGNFLGLVGKRVDNGRSLTENCIGLQTDQFFCQGSDPIRITGTPPKLDTEIAA